MSADGRYNVQLATDESGLIVGADVSNHGTDQPHVTPMLERLATLDFIGRGENVLLRGQSGVGKTMLAKNLGHAALLAGNTVRFTTLAAALADLLQQESLPAFERRLKRYTRPALLILDELGYLPCDSRAADILYNIISRRHEKRSTVISTNLAFKQWGSCRSRSERLQRSPDLAVGDGTRRASTSRRRRRFNGAPTSRSGMGTVEASPSSTSASFNGAPTSRSGMAA